MLLETSKKHLIRVSRQVSSLALCKACVNSLVVNAVTEMYAKFV